MGDLSGDAHHNHGAPRVLMDRPPRVRFLCPQGRQRTQIEQRVGPDPHHQQSRRANVIGYARGNARAMIAALLTRLSFTSAGLGCFFLVARYVRNTDKHLDNLPSLLPCTTKVGLHTDDHYLLGKCVICRGGLSWAWRS